MHASGTSTTLVYFAPVPWDNYPQRPQYFVQHFLRRPGTQVVWIDPYPTRLPRLTDFRKGKPAARMPSARPPGLTVLTVPALPLEPLALGRWINRVAVWRAFVERLRSLVQHTTTIVGVGRPSALALEAIGSLGAARTFYDAMDDFPEFYQGLSRAAARAHEGAIARAVDVVVASCSSLWEKFADTAADRVLLHNAFEMSALPEAPAPRTGPPIFGYVGCIGSWFDWPIVMRLAEAVQPAAVHIVGPCFVAPPGPLPSNVTLFPACPLSGAIEHFRTFSVGLVPFLRTALTNAVDPVKYYGYRAMGLPVLSTTFGEMARRGEDDGVLFLDRDAPLVRVSADAVVMHVSPDAVEQFRRAHTWEQRFADTKFFERIVADAG